MSNDLPDMPAFFRFFEDNLIENFKMTDDCDNEDGTIFTSYLYVQNRKVGEKFEHIPEIFKRKALHDHICFILGNLSNDYRSADGFDLDNFFRFLTRVHYGSQPFENPFEEWCDFTQASRLGWNR